MKKVFILIAIGCLISVNNLAQSADEKEVTSRVEALRLAMISASKASLEDLAAPELSYGHSSGKVEDKAAFVEAIVSGSSRFMTITLTEQTVKVIDNTAIVRHKLVAETGTKEKPGTANLAVLLIWQKQKGQWKLLARHATKLI